MNVVPRLRGVVKESFWFVPALCLTVAGVLATGLLQVDRAAGSSLGTIAFTGGPSAAREMLSAIASSTLTLAGLVFSITIVVLSLTSSQFSPRVLRTFLRDRGTQLALGVFLSTYVYALLTLRAVRGQDSDVDSFVPGLTITVAFLLVLLSIGMFVYYIHHIAQSIRAVTIIERTAKDVRAAIDRLHPRPDEGPAEPTVTPPLHAPRTVTATRPGVLTSVDVDGLVEAAEAVDALIRVVPGPGDFIAEGAPLLEVSGADDVDERRLHRQLAVQGEREMDQDIGFGFRQLVDIAERALSPGVNDPTTAVQCLDQIHDLLRRLGTRPFPTVVHADDDGVPRVLWRTPSWPDYVQMGLDEIRHWGASSPHVQRRMRHLLRDLLDTVDHDRRPPLQHQLRLLDARAALDLPDAERPLATEAADGGP